MDAAELLLSFYKSRAFLIAINPSSCGILGYRPTTSIVHKVRFKVTVSTCRKVGVSNSLVANEFCDPLKFGVLRN